MIYKGHDIRLEKQHFRVTNLETGVSWTEDTLTDTKHEIDLITESGEHYLWRENNEKSV